MALAPLVLQAWMILQIMQFIYVRFVDFCLGDDKTGENNPIDLHWRTSITFPIHYNTSNKCNCTFSCLDDKIIVLYYDKACNVLYCWNIIIQHAKNLKADKSHFLITSLIQTLVLYIEFTVHSFPVIILLRPIRFYRNS